MEYQFIHISSLIYETTFANIDYTLRRPRMAKVYPGIEVLSRGEDNELETWYGKTHQR